MAHTLVDLRWMIPGYAGGIEILARALVNELLGAEPRREFTLILPIVDSYDFDLRRHPNFHIQVCDGPGSYWDKLNWQFRKRIANRKGQTIDGVWVNGRRTTAKFALSLSGIIDQDLYPLKNVLLVPDIQHEYLPELFSTQELANRQRDFAASAKQAQRIVTISEFSRRTLAERYQIPAEKIRVALPAADAIFGQRVSCPEKAWEKYRIRPGGYLFYPANTWRHKNHSLALRALAELRDRHALSLPLVCTGTPKEAHTSLLTLAGELGLQENFQFLGYCPRAELPALYQGAIALVYPSLFEGFGMPVLEAMACRCPVICSNTTSLPEAAGEAALFIEPDQPGMLAEAIWHIHSEPELRANLIRQGHKQAGRFSWAKFTASILQSLDDLESSSRAQDTRAMQQSLQHQAQSKKLSTNPHLRQSRTSFSRGKLGEAVEYYHQRQIQKATGAFLFGIITGPDVFFWTIFYPFIRDAFLRRILQKFG